MWKLVSEVVGKMMRDVNYTRLMIAYLKFFWNSCLQLYGFFFLYSFFFFFYFYVGAVAVAVTWFNHIEKKIPICVNLVVYRLQKIYLGDGLQTRYDSMLLLLVLVLLLLGGVIFFFFLRLPPIFHTSCLSLAEMCVRKVWFVLKYFMRLSMYWFISSYLIPEYEYFCFYLI